MLCHRGRRFYVSSAGKKAPCVNASCSRIPEAVLISDVVCREPRFPFLGASDSGGSRSIESFRTFPYRLRRPPELGLCWRVLFPLFSLAFSFLFTALFSAKTFSLALRYFLFSEIFVSLRCSVLLWVRF